MSRPPVPVTCHVTGIEGMSNIFCKHGSYYYKDEDTYAEYRKDINDRKDLIEYIAREFFGYAKGGKFPTIITKKLKELNQYPNCVIMQTFKDCDSTIRYWINNKEFSSLNGKFCYIMAIIQGNIDDTFEKYQKQKEIEKRLQKKFPDYYSEDIANGRKKYTKNITQFLN